MEDELCKPPSVYTYVGFDIEGVIHVIHSRKRNLVLVTLNVNGMESVL